MLANWLALNKLHLQGQNRKDLLRNTIKLNNLAINFKSANLLKKLCNAIQQKLIFLLEEHRICTSVCCLRNPLKDVGHFSTPILTDVTLLQPLAFVNERFSCLPFKFRLLWLADSIYYTGYKLTIMICCIKL